MLSSPPRAKARAKRLLRALHSLLVLVKKLDREQAAGLCALTTRQGYKATDRLFQTIEAAEEALRGCGDHSVDCARDALDQVVAMFLGDGCTERERGLGMDLVCKSRGGSGLGGPCRGHLRTLAFAIAIVIIIIVTLFPFVVCCCCCHRFCPACRQRHEPHVSLCQGCALLALRGAAGDRQGGGREDA